jgi:hypothetical protein
MVSFAGWLAAKRNRTWTASLRPTRTGFGSFGRAKAAETFQFGRSSVRPATPRCLPCPHGPNSLIARKITGIFMFPKPAATQLFTFNKNILSLNNYY